MFFNLKAYILVIEPCFLGEVKLMNSEEEWNWEEDKEESEDEEDW